MREMTFAVKRMWMMALLPAMAWAQGTNFFSVQQGSWHSLSTWTNASPISRWPGTGDYAQISHLVSVTQNVVVSSLNMNGGALDIAEGVAVWAAGGTSVWYSATLEGGGSLWNRGFLRLTGAAPSQVEGTLWNDGDMTFVQTPSLQLNGDLHNTTQGMMAVQQAPSQLWTLQGTGNLYNTGTFYAQPFTTIAVTSVRFHNRGGTLWLGTGSHFQVSSSRGTNYHGFYTLEPQSVFTPSDNSTNLYSGDFSSTGDGKWRMQTGALFFSYGGTGTAFNLQGGGFQWLGGTMNVHPNYRLTNQGHMTIGGSGSTNPLLLQGSLVNCGAVSLLGSTSAVPLQVIGGNLYNQSSGTWTFSGTNPAISGSGQFYNNTGRVFFAAGGTTAVNMVFFNRGGTSVFQQGTAQLIGEMSDGLFLLNGGTWGGGMSFFMSGGRLGGSGLMEKNLYHNQGTLSPGQSPGRLEIIGDYQQSGAQATLLMEVAGAEPGVSHDQVAVSGAGTVSGILTVDLLEGYDPPPATRLDLLLSSTMTGRFAATNLPALSGGRFLIVRYLPTGVQLRVATPEDTDGDALPDAWELTYFENLDVSDGAGDDQDEDRFPDWHEYLAETNPTNSASFFHVAQLAATSQVPDIAFAPSATNRLYTLQRAESLVLPAWSNVPGAGPRWGTGGADALRPDSVSATNAYFRVTVEFP